MAAINFDDYDESGHGGRVATALNWAGAFLSIVLIAGLATWGWKLWVRDVTGIPVVRALEGPMRIAPADPGGLASEYQGLTVNRIAEERAEAAPSDQVVLAPAPATLDESEDLAMAELPSVAPAVVPVIEAEDEASADVGLAPAAEIGTPESFAEIDDDTDQMMQPLAGVSDMESRAQALDTIDARGNGPSATDLAVAAALSDLGLRPEPAVAKIEAAANVPVVTPRPQIRPENLQRVSLSQPVAVNGEIDPVTIAPGTRLVQLGAYASPEVARAEWDNAMLRFGDYMLGKERVVQEAQSGGRTFYRLRAIGFADLADARRFCGVLVAEGSNCIPVVHE